MNEKLCSGLKNQSFKLRLPAKLNEEIRRLAEMDGISINSVIIQRLAKSFREDVVGEQ